MQTKTIDRREFLATTLGGLALGAGMVRAQQPDPSGLPRWPLGATGEKICIIAREAGLDATLARRYTLSLPVSTLVCGIQSRANLRQDLTMAGGFKPVSPEEMLISDC